jgi:hypothetical protein
MFYPTLLRWAPAALAMLAFQAGAAPMGFKDSAMAMGDFGPNWSELYVNYAYTPRDAFGASALSMRSDGGRFERTALELTYTRLGKRWNFRHAQANVWLIGGAGVIRADGRSSVLASPGVQVDYETTRVYLAATGRLYRARSLNHDYGAIRAGFSFYESAYEETQPWLVVEARRMRGLSDKLEVTPMIRLINKDYFVEAGVNNMRQARFNFMYIF